jgi:hypothetical protein
MSNSASLQPGSCSPALLKRAGAPRRS